MSEYVGCGPDGRLGTFDTAGMFHVGDGIALEEALERYLRSNDDR